MKNFTTQINDKPVDIDVYGDYVIQERQYVMQINGVVVSKFEKDPSWQIDGWEHVPTGMDDMDVMAAAHALKNNDGDWNKAIAYLEDEGMDPPARDGLNTFRRTIEWMKSA